MEFAQLFLFCLTFSSSIFALSFQLNLIFDQNYDACDAAGKCLLLCSNYGSILSVLFARGLFDNLESRTNFGKHK